MTGRKTGKAYVSSPVARRLMRQLAQNVKALRQIRGWSSKQLAERAGLHFRMLENIEQEKNATSFVTVAIIAEVFDVTINQLIYYPLVPVDGIVKNARDGRFVVPPPTQSKEDSDYEFDRRL